MAEPVIPIASSIGGYTEAQVAAMSPADKWWNPASQRVEPLNTTPENLRIATEKASAARQRFIEREGYDRMGPDKSNDVFDDLPQQFDTAPTTPARAGPGLAVSPINPTTAAIGAGMGLALVGGSTALAMALRDPERVTTAGPAPPPPMIPPIDVPRPLTPLLLPTTDIVTGIVPYSFPELGYAMPHVVSRAKPRRRKKSPFPFIFS